MKFSTTIALAATTTLGAIANAQSFSSLDEVPIANSTVIIEQDLRYPSPTAPKMTLEDFHSVLYSDAYDHFGSRRLGSNDRNEMWFASIDYEWARAKELEKSTTNLRSRALATQAAVFPYMACVLEHTTGERCHQTIEETFGSSDMMVSSLFVCCIIIFDYVVAPVLASYRATTTRTS